MANDSEHHKAQNVLWCILILLFLFGLGGCISHDEFRLGGLTIPLRDPEKAAEAKRKKAAEKAAKEEQKKKAEKEKESFK